MANRSGRHVLISRNPEDTAPDTAPETAPEETAPETTDTAPETTDAETASLDNLLGTETDSAPETANPPDDTANADATGEADDTAATGETGNGQIDPATVASLNVDVTRCETKNEAGTRQCILAPHGEDVPHKFRSTPAKKEYAPVDLTALSFEDVPEEEEVTGVRETARDAAQLEIDKRVTASHADWVAAGKPEEFNKSPRKRIMFPAGQEESILHMLDRAGRFLNLRVRTAGPKTHESGARMVYYVGMDKLERKPKKTTPPAKATATEPATGADADATTEPGTEPTGEAVTAATADNES